MAGGDRGAAGGIFTGMAEHDGSDRSDEFDIDSQIPDPSGLNASFKFKFKNLAPINRVTPALMSKSSARWRELGLP